VTLHESAVLKKRCWSHVATAFRPVTINKEFHDLSDCRRIEIFPMASKRNFRSGWLLGKTPHLKMAGVILGLFDSAWKVLTSLVVDFNCQFPSLIFRPVALSVCHPIARMKIFYFPVRIDGSLPCEYWPQKFDSIAVFWGFGHFGKAPLHIWANHTDNGRGDFTLFFLHFLLRKERRRGNPLLKSGS